MYITCEQCSTIFRLDENRLKPTGSKVRCSQCRHLFVAYPPAAGSDSLDAEAGIGALAQTAPATPPSPAQDTFDQELDGIDLAELDSIMEQDRSENLADLFDSDAGRSSDRVDEKAAELDEADLDLDFESALDLNHEVVTEAADGAPEPEEEILDLDMDFELEPTDAAAAGEPLADGELSPDELDMDFELDESAPLQSDAVEQTMADDSGGGSLGEDIDMVLDGFEDALDHPEEGSATEPAGEAIADDDLSLDMDLDLEEETAASDAVDEDLELSLDEGPIESSDGIPEIAADDLDLGDVAAVLDEDSATTDREVEDEDMELSLDDDVDLTLKGEPALESGSELPAASDADMSVLSEDETDEFDLSDLDSLLDEQDEPLQASDVEEDLELTLDDGHEPERTEDPMLELEKDEDRATAGTSADMAADDLDLGGFDTILDEADVASDEPEKEELELSLDDEPDREMEMDKKSDDALEDIEELEFELDAEFEDKPVSKVIAENQSEETADEDEELDLSDIEKMLEDDTLVPSAGATGDDLDLDLAGGAEKWVDDVSDDIGLGEDGEIDLSDIEAAIDSAGDEIDTDIDVDEELELDLEPDDGTDEGESDELDLKLELESDSTPSAEEFNKEDTEDIDLSDLDFSIAEDKPAAESEIINAGDMELEFQIEEEDEPLVMDSAETFSASKTTAGFAGDVETADADSAGDGDDALIEEAFTAPPAPSKAVPKPAPVRKKKGASKSLVVILILAMLGGGGYFGYDYMIQNNIQIPYLSDFINPQPKDPNNIAKLSTLEINSKFIENAHAGRLFVVTGKVRNGYDMPCKMIRMQGKLFTKGKVLAKTEQVYAGMVVGDQELASQELAQIKQQLQAPAGQETAVLANPGQALPFMVVFSDLPADLDEFAVELVNSEKAQ